MASEREDGYYWARTKWFQYGKWQFSDWQIMRQDDGGARWFVIGSEIDYAPEEIAEVGERIVRKHDAPQP